MEQYIFCDTQWSLAQYINRLANVSRWYFEEHPDMWQSRAIIEDDIKKINELLND